jgi:hypothetical protein
MSEGCQFRSIGCPSHYLRIGRCNNLGVFGRFSLCRLSFGLLSEKEKFAGLEKENGNGREKKGTNGRKAAQAQK